jgi:hypothetical protein
MSLNIVRKNSGSPFQLQRSMVDQGGSGGAYESGGYNPEAVYNNDVANATIESLGKVVGAAISSRTTGDELKSYEKKQKRLEERGKNIDEKSTNGTDDKQISRLEKRKQRVVNRIEDTKKKVSITKEKIAGNTTLKKQ